jgi:hypothetical protein
VKDNDIALTLRDEGMSIYKLDMHKLNLKFFVIPRAVLYLTGEAQEEELSSDDETEDEIDVKIAC